MHLNFTDFSPFPLPPPKFKPSFLPLDYYNGLVIGPHVSPLASLCECVLSCSDMSESVTLCTVALQAPLSMEFSRPEYWSGYPFPSPGDIPNPEIELGSPALQADSLPTEPPGKPFKDI